MSTVTVSQEQANVAVVPQEHEVNLQEQKDAEQLSEASTVGEEEQPDASKISADGEYLAGESKYLKLDDITLHYVEYMGTNYDEDLKKPVLLCLHGVTSQAHAFDPIGQNPKVLETFRVVALDLRGHGSSDWSESYLTSDFVRDIDALVTHLDVSSVYILGMSFGGIFGMEYAGLYPDKVEALVLGDAAPWSGRDALQAQFKNRPNPRFFNSLDAAVEFKKDAFSMPMNQYGARQELNLRLKQSTNEAGKDILVWRADMKVMKTFPILAKEQDARWKNFAKISCDILILRADQDGQPPFITEFIQKKAKFYNDKTTIVTVPNTGHSMWADNLDGVLLEALPFLEERAQSIVDRCLQFCKNAF